MKIAVMGAGAVGCYYGAMLARAGHKVVLVARPPHLQAIAAKGLVLETRNSPKPCPRRRRPIPRAWREPRSCCSA